MINVQAVLESGILLAGNLNKIANERVFRNSEWLSNDDVISFGEKRESKLNEIEAS
jgi:hypothetical protein